MFLKYHISSSSEKEAICSLPFLSTFLLTEKSLSFITTIIVNYHFLLS